MNYENAKHHILAENKYLGLSVDEALAILDDHIAEWHESGGQGVPLSEFLGLTGVEYSYFVEHPRSFAYALLL